MGDAIVMLLILGVAVFLIAVAIFQWLWNITMPEQFGLKELRYWVAFRLLLIAGFLTSGSLLGFNTG